MLLLRIAVAAVLGACIGFERDRHGKPVGLRTHAIVAVAAATFMVVSTQFVLYQHYPANLPIRADPGRTASATVMGIGFLAGGAILRNGLTIRGLTTAAGLWLVTAIGLACGAGMFLVATMVTALAWTVLAVLRRIEHHRVVRQRVTVVTGGATGVAALVDAMRALGASVAQLRQRSAERRVETVFEVQVDGDVEPRRVVAALERLPGVEEVCVECEG